VARQSQFAMVDLRTQNRPVLRHVHALTGVRYALAESPLCLVTGSLVVGVYDGISAKIDSSNHKYTGLHRH
jgi:hypothetical protein